MDDKGNIKQFESDIEAKAAGFNTALNAFEARLLELIPAEDRPMELALSRYAGTRQGRKLSLHEKQAFRFGYRAALNSCRA